MPSPWSPTSKPSEGILKTDTYEKIEGLLRWADKHPLLGGVCAHSGVVFSGGGTALWAGLFLETCSNARLSLRGCRDYFLFFWVCREWDPCHVLRIFEMRGHLQCISCTDSYALSPDLGRWSMLVLPRWNCCDLWHTAAHDEKIIPGSLFKAHLFSATWGALWIVTREF